MHIVSDFDWLCWGFTKCQPLWIILCCLQKKGTEEKVQEMKEWQGRKRKMNESEEMEE